MFWRSVGIVEKKTLKDLPLSVKPCAAHEIPILQRKFKKTQRKIFILAFLNLTFKLKWYYHLYLDVHAPHKNEASDVALQR